MSKQTDNLPSMTDPRETLWASCDRPRDLIGRIPDTRQVCARCGKPEPVEDFAGCSRCSRCRAKAAEHKAQSRERSHKRIRY